MPKRLGDLRLVQLDLSNNQLGKSIASDWDWLDRPSIKSSLQNLNLSNNEVVKLIKIFLFSFKYFCIFTIKM